MIIEALIIGIIIGAIRKGRIDRLNFMQINLYGLILLAAACYGSIVVMNLGSFDKGSSLYYILQMTAYALIAIVMLANLDTKFMFVPLIGLILNVICMIANKMMTPVSESLILDLYGSEMQKLLVAGKIKYFIPMTGAKLTFLGKWIPLGKYYFYRVMPSIGDIIIFVGIILVVQGLMTDKYLQSRSSLTFSRKLFR